MGKKFEKVKAFCKEHKKGIAVVVVAGVGFVAGATMCVITKKKLNLKLGDSIPKPDYKYVTDFGAKITEFENEATHWCVSAENLKLGDIGKLGDELMRLYGERVDPDMEIWTMIENAGTKLIENC